MARLLIVFVVGLVLVAADAPAAPVAPPPREAAYYYATTVGTKWVYEVKHEGMSVDLVKVITAVTDRPAGGKVVEVGVLIEGKMVPAAWYEVSDRGLVQTGADGHAIDRLQELKLPLRPGVSWKDQPQEANLIMTPFGPERVEVAAGVFDCIRVVARHGDGPVQTLWYARGVGMVRWDRADIQLVLKSFTPGKD